MILDRTSAIMLYAEIAKLIKSQTPPLHTHTRTHTYTHPHSLTHTQIFTPTNRQTNTLFTNANCTFSKHLSYLRRKIRYFLTKSILHYCVCLYLILRSLRANDYPQSSEVKIEKKKKMIKIATFFPF